MRKRTLDDGLEVLQFVSPPTADELFRLFPIETKGGSRLSPDGEGLGLMANGTHLIYPPGHMAQMRREAAEFIFAHLTVNRKHPQMAECHLILAATAPKRRKDRNRIFAIWDAELRTVHHRSEEFRFDSDFVERIETMVSTLQEFADVCRPPERRSPEAAEIDRTVLRLRDVATECTTPEFVSQTFLSQEAAYAADLSIVHAYYLSRANIAHQVVRWQERTASGDRWAYRRAPAVKEPGDRIKTVTGYPLLQDELVNIMGCERAYRSSLPADLVDDLLHRCSAYVGPFDWYPIDLQAVVQLRQYQQSEDEDERDRSSERTEEVARFGEDASPEIRVQVAWALSRKGERLEDLDRHTEAIDVYDEMVTRFGEDAHPEIRFWVTWALIHKGLILGDLDWNTEAIDVYDEVVTRFGEDPSPELRVQVATALINKGATLEDLDRNMEAIDVYDEVVTRFGEDPSPEIRVLVATALFYKGACLGDLDWNTEAIDVYDEVVTRFGEDPSPEIRVQVAWALINKGERLEDLDRHTEAVDVYDEIVTRFDKDPHPHPDLRQAVEMAQTLLRRQ